MQLSFNKLLAKENTCSKFDDTEILDTDLKHSTFERKLIFTNFINGNKKLLLSVTLTVLIILVIIGVSASINKGQFSY